MGTWTAFTGHPHLPMIHPFSVEALYDYITGSITSVSTANFPTANASILWPFRIRRLVQVTKLFGIIGTNNTGNIDLGIYGREAKSLLVSTGSTAAGTANARQTIDITDLTLWPGDYYFATATSATTVAFIRNNTLANLLRNGGVLKALSNFPLAANPSVVVAADSFVPMGGMMLFPRTL